ncbi:hypothetical protein STANM309S_01314 [Streptomyces tanashiensis]
MGKGVADVALRRASLSVRDPVREEVAPAVEDLSGRRTEAGPRAWDYPTGSWGDESRDYHVSVRVPQAAVGQEMLAARVSLIAPDPAGGDPRPLSQGLVRAVWTDDLAMSTSINPQVAHYTGQAELAWTSSSRVSMPANRAIATARRPNWAVPCSSRRPPATRIRRNCFRRWSTSSTRRPVLCV